MFSMPLAKEGSIKRILQNLNSKKGPGSDKIPPKIVIRSAEFLSKPLTNIINATTGATQATLDWYSELMSPHTRRDF